MKRRLIAINCALLAYVIATPPVVAKEPKTKQELSGENIKKALIEFPTPPYPTAYRARWLEGAGSYWLHFDTKTGRVDAVKVLQSTGHAELDNVSCGILPMALSSRRGWRVPLFPPRFTLDHSSYARRRRAYTLDLFSDAANI